MVRHQKPLLLIAAFISIGFIAYFFREPLTSFFVPGSKNPDDPASLNYSLTDKKLLLIPKDYELKPEDNSFLESNRYDLIIDLRDQTVTTTSPIPASHPTATTNGEKVILADGRHLSLRYSSRSLATMEDTDSSSIITPLLEHNFTDEAQNIVTFTEHDCKKSVTECSSNLYKSNPNSHELLRINNKIVDVFLTQKPSIISSTHKDGSRNFLWNWKQNSPRVLQTAYSIEINNGPTQPALYKSGKVMSTTQGAYFVPTSQLKIDNASTKIKIWYSLDGTQVETPIEESILFTDNFALPETATMGAEPIFYAGWIPDWGMDRALTSIRKNPKRWNSLSPVWFFLKNDGTLIQERNINSPELTRIAKANNISLIPAITVFDADILKDVLNNHYDKHIQNILNVVDKFGYDGIDIDYESTYLADKEKLLSFVKDLSIELKKRNKKLVFTAIAKWTDEKVYSFLPQTRQVQDWAIIGQHVDEFRIMAYDFTGQNQAMPGPLSPLLWNDMILAYAVTKMPPEKIVLALPIYSHAWQEPTGDPTGSNNDLGLARDSKQTDSLQHDDIAALKRSLRSYTESRDPLNEEIRATYTEKGKKRVMYYLNAEVIKTRENLAKKYKIKGLAFWRIGGESL